LSDDSQSIVDIEAKGREVERLARRVCEYLAGRNIVAASKRDCVLSAAAGYPPGKKYAEACTRPAARGFARLVTNGVAVEVKRTVFDAGENGLEVACPACRAKVLEADEAWSLAVGAWWEGNDGAAYACRKCRKTAALNAYDGRFPWAFGSLGFTFWNWPPLSDAFVAEVAKVLGHRVRVVRCRR
jgi:hypothetical protein